MRISLIVVVALFLSACSIKPTPLTDNEIKQRVDNDLLTMFSDQEEVDGSLDIYQAMARGIKYNLTYRLKMLEEALSQRQLDVSRFDLLPKLTADAGYHYRNKYSGSSSSALDGNTAGEQSLRTSTSQERNRYTTDVGVMWNVLDFGVSYIQAKQQTDRILIAEERRRKAIQNIVLDIRSAYWRAVGTDELIADMTLLLDQTNAAIADARKIEEQLLKPPREVMEYQRALLENVRLLWGLIQQLKNARTELATLMNLKPGTPFHLEQPDTKHIAIPEISLPVEEMVREALVMRPELREEDYKNRITLLNTKKAILEMLPGINLEFSYNTDTNKYLAFNDWMEAGAGISMNIFNLFSRPALLKSIEAQHEVDEMRRKVTSIAVMTQVHLAYQNYLQSLEEYKISKQLDKINKRIDKQMTAEKKSGLKDQLTAIKTKTNVLVTRMRYNIAYAGLQNALGRMYNSMGLDFLPEAVDGHDVDTIAGELKLFFSQTARRLSPEQKTSSQGETVVMTSVTDTVTEPVDSDTPEDLVAIVTAHRLRFRRAPSLDAPPLTGPLFKGEVLPVLEQTPGWVRVDNHGVSGWVAGEYTIIKPQ